MFQHDVTSLPQWARNKIAFLEEQVRTYKAAVKILEEEPNSETDTYVRESYFVEGQGLPKGCIIGFSLGPNPGDHIEAKVEDGKLVLRSVQNIKILPESGMLLNLKLVELPSD